MYRVMLEEDDGAVRYTYRRMKAWGKNGFSIAEEAANGRQAVDKIENLHPLQSQIQKYLFLM